MATFLSSWALPKCCDLLSFPVWRGVGPLHRCSSPHIVTPPFLWPLGLRIPWTDTIRRPCITGFWAEGQLLPFPLGDSSLSRGCGLPLCPPPTPPASLVPKQLNLASVYAWKTRGLDPMPLLLVVGSPYLWGPPPPNTHTCPLHSPAAAARQGWLYLSWHFPFSLPVRWATRSRALSRPPWLLGSHSRLFRLYPNSWKPLGIPFSQLAWVPRLPAASPTGWL